MAWSLDFSAFGYIKDAIEKKGLTRLKKDLQHYRDKDNSVDSINTAGVEEEATLIDLAFQNDNQAIVKELLNYEPLDLSISGKRGRTALHHLVADLDTYQDILTDLIKNREVDFGDLAREEELDTEYITRLLSRIEQIIPERDARNKAANQLLASAIQNSRQELISTVLPEYKQNKFQLEESSVKAAIGKYRESDTPDQNIIENIKKLVEVIPHNLLNVRNKKGYSLLSAAAAANDVEMVDYISRTYEQAIKANPEIADSKNALAESLNYIIHNESQDANAVAQKIQNTLLENGTELDLSIPLQQTIITKGWVYGESRQQKEYSAFKILCDYNPQAALTLIKRDEAMKGCYQDKREENSALYIAFSSPNAKEILPQLIESGLESGYITPEDIQFTFNHAIEKLPKLHEQDLQAVVDQLNVLVDSYSQSQQPVLQVDDAQVQALYKQYDSYNTDYKENKHIYEPITNILANIVRSINIPNPNLTLENPGYFRSSSSSILDILLDNTKIDAACALLARKDFTINGEIIEKVHAIKETTDYQKAIDAIINNHELTGSLQVQIIKSASEKNKSQQQALKVDDTQAQALYKQYDSYDTNDKENEYIYEPITNILSNLVRSVNDPNLTLENPGYFRSSSSSILDILLDNTKIDAACALLARKDFTINGEIIEKVHAIKETTDYQKAIDAIINNHELTGSLQVQIIKSASEKNYYSARDTLMQGLSKNAQHEVATYIVIEQNQYEAFEHLYKKGYLNHDALEQVLSAHHPSHASQPIAIDLYQKGHSEMLYALLKRDLIKDVNSPAKESGDTLLHLACMHGHPRLAKLIVDKSDNLHITNAKGLTPLAALAIGRGSPAAQQEIMETLINNPKFQWAGESKVQTLQKDSAPGFSYVKTAYLAGNRDLADELYNTLQEQCSQEQEPSKRKTKLKSLQEEMRHFFISVARNKDSELLQSLITRQPGVYKNAQKYKNTPLIAMVKAGAETQNIEFMLNQSDTNVYTEDDEGKTPVIHAIESGQPEIVEALLAKHNNGITGGSTGASPLIYAYELREQLKSKQPGGLWEQIKAKFPSSTDNVRHNMIDRLDKIMAILIKEPKVEINTTKYPNWSLQHNEQVGPNLLGTISEQGDIDLYDKIAKRADLDINTGGYDKDGNPISPAIIAFEHKQYDILSKLLERRDLNINVTNPPHSEEGHTLFELIYNDLNNCRQEYRKLKEKMLVHATQANNPDQERLTALKEKQDKLHAIFHKKLMSRAYSDEYPLDVSKTNIEGDNIFMMICARGDTALAPALWHNTTFDINHQNHAKQTALMMAAANGNHEIIRCIFSETQPEKGTRLIEDINAQDELGHTALTYAYTSGNKEVIEYLYEQGASITAQAKKGILTAACSGGNPELVKDALSKGIQAQDDPYALHHLITNKDKFAGEYTQTFRALIESGADVNMVFDTGVEQGQERNLSPLMIAISNRDIESVRLLLQNPRLNVNIRDSQGNTALTLAAYLGDKDILNEILNHPRVDINAYNHDGATAFMIAATNVTVKDRLQAQKQETSDRSHKDIEVPEFASSYWNQSWRGDREIMGILVENGADPYFGEYYKGLAQKVLHSTIQAGMLSAGNNILLSTSPIFKRIGSTVINTVYAKNLYDNISGSVEDTVRDFLQSGTSQEKKLDFSNKCMIGVYHKKRFGRIEYGENLKSHMETRLTSVYRNVDNALFSAKELHDVQQNNKLDLSAQNDIHKALNQQYCRIRYELDHKWMLPWTRYSLNKLAGEVSSAASSLLKMQNPQSPNTKDTINIEDRIPQLHKLLSPKYHRQIINTKLQTPETEPEFKTIENFEKVVHLIATERILTSPELRYNALSYLRKKDKASNKHTESNIIRKLFNRFNQVNEQTLEGLNAELGKASEMAALDKALESIKAQEGTSGADRKDLKSTIQEHTTGKTGNKWTELLWSKYDLDERLERDKRKGEAERSESSAPSFKEQSIEMLAGLLKQNSEKLVDEIAKWTGRGAGVLGAGSALYTIDDTARTLVNGALFSLNTQTILTTGKVALLAGTTLATAIAGKWAWNSLTNMYNRPKNIEASNLSEALPLIEGNQQQFHNFIDKARDINQQYKDIPEMHEPELQKENTKNLEPEAKELQQTSVTKERESSVQETTEESPKDKMVTTLKIPEPGAKRSRTTSDIIKHGPKNRNAKDFNTKRPESRGDYAQAERDNKAANKEKGNSRGV